MTFAVAMQSIVRQLENGGQHAASVYVPDPVPVQSMYSQPQRMMIKKDDPARKSVTAVSYLTRIKRKLGCVVVNVV